MIKDYCKLQFISESKKVRNMVRCLLDFIDGYAPASDVRDDLKLVFSELLYNAVIHGNREDRSKRVYVQIKAEDDNLWVQVQDEGPGFDYRKMIEYAGTEAALLSGHGRGIILVCALTDNLSFNETGNQIRFEKRLK